MRSESTGRTCRLPIRLLIAAGLALLLAACGSSSQLNPGYPVLTASATNSGGKFSSYIVGVDSIILTQQNGTVVSLAPSSQVVDLVRLADFSQLVSAYSVPYGTYVSATIQLDYSASVITCLIVTGAHCVNVNIDGKPVGATVVGPANGILNVLVTFDPAKPLVVNLQQTTPVNINFDLLAFNVIDTSAAVPKVAVQPYLTMHPSVVNSTPLRASGLYVTVQSGYIVMNLRPFYSAGGQLGAVVVQPTADAYYNVNGVSYTGAAGLAALAGLQQTAAIALYGTISSLTGPTPDTNTNPTFSASEIYAGTIEGNDGLSGVQGMVSARSGNVLTLLGATVNCYNGTSYFVGKSVATIVPSIPVTQDGVSASGITTQSISVGQYVAVRGTTPIDANNNCALDSTGSLPLDASLGSARLENTRLWGSLIAAEPTNATFDLLSLGLYAPNSYSFAGTGATPADPAAYLVNTGTTDLSGTAASTLMAIDGFATPFGAAPPDFNATAVTPGSDIEQTLVVQWPSGEASPFQSASSGGYVINLSKTTIGSIYDIFTGPVGMNLKSLPASPLITTTGGVQNNLQLSIGSTALTTGVSMFATPAAYYAAVNTALNGTNKMFKFVAAGHYNSVSNTFVAQRIDMALL